MAVCPLDIWIETMAPTLVLTKVSKSKFLNLYLKEGYLFGLVCLSR